MIYLAQIQSQRSRDNDSIISVIHTHFGSGRYRRPLARGFPSCRRVSLACTDFYNSCRPFRKPDLRLSALCTRGCTRTWAFPCAPRTSSPPRTSLPRNFLQRETIFDVTLNQFQGKLPFSVAFY